MSPRMETLRVLVIDDDELDRAAVRRVLRLAHPSVEVVECAGADEALRLEDRDFACILLDYLLPGLTATELLPLLEERWPAAPIVVLTGYGDEQVAVDVMKAGAVDYVPKDRLDARIMARLLGQVSTLRASRLRLDEAERARAAYAAKLRQLVDATPPLYRGLVIEERLRAAAATAVRLLEAQEAFVAVRVDGRWIREVARGDVTTATHLEVDPRWARSIEWAQEVATERKEHLQDPRWSPDSDDEVIQQRLFDKAGSSVGVIAVRGAAARGSTLDAYQSLLAQLGHALSSSVENLRLYRAARSALASRDAVMAVVSHDLRSPLSTIKLSLGLLRQPRTATVPVKVLDRMERATAHMKRLLDDLIDVTRIDSHNFEVSVGRETVANVIADALALCEAIAHEHRLELVVEGALPTVEVKCDRHRLVQVLSNLIGNAIRVAPPGSRISITVEASPAEVTFAIRDRGPGIEPEHLPHIFDRFWRKDGRGLGLGLFIARAIVHAHGGRIWAQSTLGEGATFLFSIATAAR